MDYGERLTTMGEADAGSKGKAGWFHPLVSCPFCPLTVDYEELAPHGVLTIGVWGRASRWESYYGCIRREGSSYGGASFIKKVRGKMGVGDA